jgi:hypothetical protein
MKNLKFVKVQQSTPNSSLEINVPKRFSRWLGWEKSDFVSCRTVALRNGHHALVVQKVSVKPTTLVELEE